MESSYGKLYSKNSFNGAIVGPQREAILRIKAPWEALMANIYNTVG